MARTCLSLKSTLYIPRLAARKRCVTATVLLCAVAWSPVSTLRAFTVTVRRRCSVGRFGRRLRFASIDLVHGCLHVIGYDHETDTDAERMERRERAVLRRVLPARAVRDLF